MKSVTRKEKIEYLIITVLLMILVAEGFAIRDIRVENREQQEVTVSERVYLKHNYIYCKRERISWKTFFSEREFAMLVYDKALEKKQRFTDILKEIQPYMKQPYTKNCPDILILKKDIEKNIERTNKILQRAERVYHY